MWRSSYNPNGGREFRIQSLHSVRPAEPLTVEEDEELDELLDPIDAGDTTGRSHKTGGMLGVYPIASKSEWWWLLLLTIVTLSLYIRALYIMPFVAIMCWNMFIMIDLTILMIIHCKIWWWFNCRPFSKGMIILYRRWLVHWDPPAGVLAGAVGFDPMQRLSAPSSHAGRWLLSNLLIASTRSHRTCGQYHHTHKRLRRCSCSKTFRTAPSSPCMEHVPIPWLMFNYLRFA